MESNIKIPFLNTSIYSLSGYSIMLTLLALLTILVLFLRKKIKTYTGHRKRLIDMSEDYERRRGCRNDLRYHYDWALDRGERETAKNIGKEVLKLDKELQEMYENYQNLKEKGFVPLKNL